MRKLLAGLFFVAVPAFGAINITPGSGQTVHTDTVNGQEYQAVKIIDGTTGGTSSATVTAVGLKVDLSTTQVVQSTVGVVQVTTPWTVQPIGITTMTTLNTTTYVTNVTTSPIQVQNVGGTLVSVGYQSSGGSVPVQIQNAAANAVPVQTTGTVTVTGAVSQSGTWTLQPGNTQNTTPWLVQQVNTGVGTSTVTYNNVGQPVTSTSTVIVATATANFLPITSTGAYQPLSQTSSGTIRTDFTTWNNGIFISTANPLPVISTGVISATITNTPTVNAYIQNISSAIISSSSTLPVQTTGTVSATIITALPSGTNTIGAFVSSSVYVVNVTTSPIQIQGVTGALTSVGFQASGGSVPVQVQNASTNPVLIQSTGTLSVAIVAGAAAGGTSSNFIQTTPSAGTAAGFSSPNGNMQMARVDTSSNVYANSMATTTLQFIGITSTGSFQPLTQTSSGTLRADLMTWNNGIFLSTANPLPVISTGTISASVINTPNVNAFSQNTATVTHNNVGQPVTSSYTIISTTYAAQIGFGGLGQPVTSTQTVVASTSALPMGITVSSTAVVAAAFTQGSTVTLQGDSMGRAMVTGFNYGLVSSTWSVNVSTGTGEIILLSSATAPNRYYFCGCILRNNSATNSGIVLYSVRSNLYTFPAVPLGAPANYPNGGVWPGCMNPFFVGAIGGQIVFKADVAATSVAMNCQYYTSP